MYGKGVSRILCALACLVSLACGTVEPATDRCSGDACALGVGGNDNGGGDGATGDGAASDLGAMGDTGMGGTGTGGTGAPDSGGVAPVCPQVGQLSHFVACREGCATECRDQLAKPQVGCKAQEGWTCVTDCGVCP